MLITLLIIYEILFKFSVCYFFIIISSLKIYFYLIYNINKIIKNIIIKIYFFNKSF